MVEEIESARDAETGVWAETVVAEYLPGLELDDHIVAFLHGEEIHFHQDHLGSVLMLTDADGAVLQRYRYDIHGNATVLDASGNELARLGVESDGVRTEAGAPLSPYLFTGRRLDRETGLYYYRNRYYSPLLGKFISPDPLDYVDGMNVYAYVNGNVVNFMDPMGTELSNAQLQRKAKLIMEADELDTKAQGLRNNGDYHGAEYWTSRAMECRQIVDEMERLSAANEKAQRGHQERLEKKAREEKIKEQKRMGSPWKEITGDHRQFLALSISAYEEENSPRGWERIGNVSLKMAGFFVSVNRREADGLVVVAFRGTQLTSIPDWCANIRQGLGKATIQYTMAMLVAESLAQQYPGKRIVFTGHSLGGGLATAASLVTGKEAVTFNPAGVHPNTALRFAGVPEVQQKVIYEKRITSYVLDGEALDAAQHFVLGLSYFMPDNGGNIRRIPSENIDAGALGKHTTGSLWNAPSPFQYQHATREELTRERVKKAYGELLERENAKRIVNPDYGKHPVDANGDPLGPLSSVPYFP